MTIKELYEWAEEHNALDAIIVTDNIVHDRELPKAQNPWYATVENKDAVILEFK